MRLLIVLLALQLFSLENQVQSRQSRQREHLPSNEFAVKHYKVKKGKETEVGFVSGETLKKRMKKAKKKASKKVKKKRKKSKLQENIRPERKILKKGKSTIKKDKAIDKGKNLKSQLDPEFVFEGLSNDDNAVYRGFYSNPPDTVGDVGFTYYIQAVNTMIGIFDKVSGSAIFFLPLGDLWGSDYWPECGLDNGDPNVIYDQFERAFVINQFTRSCEAPGSYCYQCFAFLPEDTFMSDGYLILALEATKPQLLGDYPRLGMFGDSYVLTTNDFSRAPDGGFEFEGHTVYLIERKPIYNSILNVGIGTLPIYDIGVLLPADNDGSVEEPLSPAIPLMGYVHEPYSIDFTPGLRVFEFLWDYQSSTGSFDEVTFLPVADYTFIPCSPTYLNCIPQPGVSQDAYVHSLGDRLMHQLAYQNYGTHESMVVVHSVLADTDSQGNNVAGSRWYEIHREVDSTSETKYSVHQQSTFAPNDSISRWMGSIAQDKNGNIALGYSVSDASSVYPGIRFTGRLSTDPLGCMTLGEGVIVEGSASQTSTGGLSRWGDYTSMNVDPEDFCTFYYTNEYYKPDWLCDLFGIGYCWTTKIGRFKLPSCS